MMALLRRDRRGWRGRRHRLQRRAAQRTLFDQGDGEEGERKEGGCREENEAEENRKIGGGAEDPGAHGEGEPAFWITTVVIGYMVPRPTPPSASRAKIPASECPAGSIASTMSTKIESGRPTIGTRL